MFLCVLLIPKKYFVFHFSTVVDDRRTVNSSITNLFSLSNRGGIRSSVGIQRDGESVLAASFVGTE